jgi:hypothetical protein
MPLEDPFEILLRTRARLGHSKFAIRTVRNYCRNAIVGHQIARIDVLLVSSKVREREGVVVDYLQKTFLPSPVLNIRPPGLAKARHVEGISFAYILLLVRPKASWRITHSLNPRVLTTATITLLQGVHRLRENQRAKALCHIRPPVAARSDGQAVALEDQL